MEEIYNLIDRSKFTLVGYNFRDQKLKDYFMSKIPYFEIKEINTYFSLTSLIREVKIESLFKDVDVPKYILIDINNTTSLSDKNIIFFSIRSIILEFSKLLSISGFKLIVTIPTYAGLSKDSICISGGNSLMYISDLVLNINDNCINVVKNRYGNNIKIPIDLNDYICDNEIGN